ncbi:MAG: hydrogenase nickel incorporation protein HypB [Clostridia bacterium]|nr:hydrogenase nickel incorporation protein HypB [Clostridia bacterium]
MRVYVVEDLLAANEEVARENRRLLDQHRLTIVNLIGGPGAGKTTLLEKAVAYLGNRLRLGVIEGDVYTTRDAERLERLGVEVVQINTAGACHLDAAMVGRVLPELPLADLDLVIVENVGNLVCPAEFDLGEDLKVAVISVAEGSDKPAKYPLVFHESQACVLTKTDLLPYTDFDLEAFRTEVAQINPLLEIFPVSARTGAGMEAWCRWLSERARRSPASASGC